MNLCNSNWLLLTETARPPWRWRRPVSEPRKHPQELQQAWNYPEKHLFSGGLHFHHIQSIPLFLWYTNSSLRPASTRDEKEGKHAGWRRTKERAGSPATRAGCLPSSLPPPLSHTLCLLPARERQGQTQVHATCETACAVPSLVSVSWCYRVQVGLGFCAQRWQGQRTVQREARQDSRGTRLPLLASRSSICPGSQKKSNYSAISQLNCAILLCRTKKVVSSQSWGSKTQFQITLPRSPYVVFLYPPRLAAKQTAPWHAKKKITVSSTLWKLQTPV